MTTPGDPLISATLTAGVLVPMGVAAVKTVKSDSGDCQCGQPVDHDDDDDDQ